MMLSLFQDALALALSQGAIVSYVFIFFIMFLEGPIITYIAAFTASLGYLNIWIVFILSIFGNQVPDNILYFIGRSLKRETVEKFASFVKIDKSNLGVVENNLKKHSIKSLLIFKIVPQLPIIGILLTGYVRMPYKKFFWLTLITNTVFAAIFTLLGFYSGLAASSFLKYLKLTEYIIPSALIIGIMIYFVTKRLSKGIIKNSNSSAAIGIFKPQTGKQFTPSSSIKKTKISN